MSLAIYLGYQSKTDIPNGANIMFNQNPRFLIENSTNILGVIHDLALINPPQTLPALMYPPGSTASGNIIGGLYCRNNGTYYCQNQLNAEYYDSSDGSFTNSNQSLPIQGITYNPYLLATFDSGAVFKYSYLSNQDWTFYLFIKKTQSIDVIDLVNDARVIAVAPSSFNLQADSYVRGQSTISTINNIVVSGMGNILAAAGYTNSIINPDTYNGSQIYNTPKNCYIQNGYQTQGGYISNVTYTAGGDCQLLNNGAVGSINPYLQYGSLQIPFFLLPSANIQSSGFTGTPIFWIGDMICTLIPGNSGFYDLYTTSGEDIFAKKISPLIMNNFTKGAK